jgi:hypothetical protein
MAASVKGKHSGVKEELTEELNRNKPLTNREKRLIIWITTPPRGVGRTDEKR